MANAFEDYMDTLPMVAEYKMNEASGSLADTGSGTVGALTVQGTPLYQQAGYAFEDPLVTPTEVAYSIDFDGVSNGDIAHTNNIADLEALTEGAIVAAYSLDSGYATCEPIMIKPEVGTGKFCQIFFDTVGDALRFQINDGAGNVRRLDYGNATATSRYNPGHDSPDVTHIIVVQYNATTGEYEVWLDGHLLTEQPGIANEDNNTTTGTPGWISTLGSGNVLGVGGRPEYNGSGSFVSSSVNFNGQIEYVGFSDRPLTFVEINTMFARFMGGIERANSSTTVGARYERRNVVSTTTVGPPAGLDTVTYLTGASLTGATSTFPNAVAAKRCNQVFVPSAHWVTNRSNTRGHSHPIATPNGESDVDQAMNAYTISREGFSVAAINGAASSSTMPQSQLGKGGFWRTGSTTTGSPARGWYTINGESWDRYNFPETGIGRDENQVLPTTNSGQPHTIFQWNYLAGSEGLWTNTTLTVMSTRPINQSAGRNETIKYSEDGRFLAIATQSISGQNAATGGGGVHIYEVDREAGNIYGIAYNRQTLSGYTPANADVGMIQFFNDGTTDYAIVCINTNSGGGMTGAVSSLGIFKRSGSTWTATANLFNNGVTPSAIGTGNINFIRSAWCFGDDLYVAYWRTGGSALTTHDVFEHFRWNGTTFESQGFIENPYETVETTPIFDATPTAMYVTDDGKGAVVGWGGSAPTTAVDTRNVMGYDRDPDTGVLTRRDNWPNYRGGTSLYETDGWKYVNGGYFGITNINVTDFPDGRDGE